MRTPPGQKSVLTIYGGTLTFGGHKVQASMEVNSGKTCAGLFLYGVRTDKDILTSPCRVIVDYVHIVIIVVTHQSKIESRAKRKVDHYKQTNQPWHILSQQKKQRSDITPKISALVK